MRKSILAVAGLAALCGCGRSGDSGQEGTAQAQVTAPAGKAEARREPEGQWRRVEMNGGAALLFAEGRERPLAGLRCDAQLESLLIERMTVEPQSGVDTMKVTAGGETERLPIIWDGASLPIATATLRLEDPLTDRLSGLSGTIEIELKGEEKLMLPPDRRIGTLIEECRQS